MDLVEDDQRGVEALLQGGVRREDPVDRVVGAFQVVIALFKLGDLTRYISESVILGFMAGAGLLVATVLLSAGGAALLQQGVPRLDVIGPNNDVRVSIRVDPTNGSAGLEVLGVDGRRALFLGTSKDGLPNLALYDPTGQRIVREVAP